MFLVALRLFAALTLLTGLIYPVVVTVFAQTVAPTAANGSVVRKDGKSVGSSLLAQGFKDPKYFTSRPSASDPAYATVASGASNLGPTSEKQQKAVAERLADFKARFGATDVPADMLTASGSGLDPHISPAAARAQIDAVAKARGFSTAQRDALAGLVEKSIEPPQLGFLGEARVNVLLLNLAVDAL